MHPLQELYSRFHSGVSRCLSASDELIESYMLSIFAGGHLLLMWPPWVAKTRSARVAASLLGLDFARIQFTADLLPSDITGSEIYDPRSQSFTVKKWPIFHSCILADEINRAPAKVQSALLEAMEEKQVTIAGDPFMLPSPFLVIATMNPFDGIGTYALPEASLDRFLLSCELSYPTVSEEISILSGHSLDIPSQPVMTHKEIEEIRSKIDSEVFVDEKIYDYVARLMLFVRENKNGALTTGVSLRASLSFIRCAKVLALLDGRDFIVPEDIKRLVSRVLRHRLHLSFSAASKGITKDSYIASLLASVPIESIR